MAKKKVIDPVVEETIVDDVVIDERTPADKVKEFIAGNGISHIDAIRVGGLSQEDVAQVVTHLKMAGQLFGDGSGRLWA